MIWFLPLIVIGGLFFPVLGYLVIAMMAFFLTSAFLNGRYWCWNLCPRGAFLDIVMPKMTLRRTAPLIFSRMWFRWLIFALLMGFVVFRVIRTGGNIIAIGAVFVSMCLITTVISIVLGGMIRPRSWCAICPMGTLQEHIHKLKKK